MKKISFVLALMLATCFSFAQIAQGTKWLSGSASFSLSNGNGNYIQPNYYDNSQSKSSSLGFSPTFGYFFKDNQLLGVGALFSNYNTNSENNYIDSKSIYESNSSMYGGKILYRKYFPLSSKFYIAAGGNANFQIGKGDYTYKEFSNNILALQRIEDSNLTQIQIGGEAVVVYFISQKLSTELSLGSLGLNYSKRKGTYKVYNPSDQSEATDNTDSSSFNFSSSFLFNNISLGFQLYF